MSAILKASKKDFDSNTQKYLTILKRYEVKCENQNKTCRQIICTEVEKTAPLQIF